MHTGNHNDERVFPVVIPRFFVACQENGNFLFRLQELGLEKGWGDTAECVLEMIHLLLDILQAPDPETLEKFLGRIPMVFNVVILSPHGYFGQANVLGLPDTGGQVREMACPCRPCTLTRCKKGSFMMTHLLLPLILRLSTYWIKFAHWKVKFWITSKSRGFR